MKKLLSLALMLLLLAAAVLPGYADGSVWYCPKCGRANNANFCPQDGTRKPSDLNGGYNGGSYNGSSYSRTVRIGEILRFGRYEQDNASWDGAETIEWQVLAVDGSRALVISRYGLEAAQPFHSSYTATTWENCALRSWLNSSFYRNAFSSSEQSAIQITYVENTPSQSNPQWTTPGGNNTYDRIFLLSFAEAKQYFLTETARLCPPTAYTQAQGAWTPTSGRTPSVVWWLRSPGPTQNYAACVDLNGFAGYYNSVGNNYVCVRPAMWVDVSQLS